MIKAGIVGGGTNNQTFVAEYVAENIRVVSLRDIVHHDVLHASLACRTGDNLSDRKDLIQHEGLLELDHRLA